MQYMKSAIVLHNVPDCQSLKRRASARTYAIIENSFMIIIILCFSSCGFKPYIIMINKYNSAKTLTEQQVWSGDFKAWCILIMLRCSLGSRLRLRQPPQTALSIVSASLSHVMGEVPPRSHKSLLLSRKWQSREALLWWFIWASHCSVMEIHLLEFLMLCRGRMEAAVHICRLG